jgi:hypothetical protein
MTYALGFQMRAAQAMMVLVEVHHLKSIELVGDFLNLLLLPRLDDLHALCIPSVFSDHIRISFLVLPTT